MVFNDLPDRFFSWRFKFAAQPVLDLVALGVGYQAGVEMRVVGDGADIPQLPERNVVMGDQEAIGLNFAGLSCEMS